jgi:hypothetical protein
MRILVHNVMSMQIMVSRAVMQCSLVEGTNVLEKTAASILEGRISVFICSRCIAHTWGL